MFQANGYHFGTLCAEKGYLSIVEFLVNPKADINSLAHGYTTGTALHYAARNAHLSVVI